MGWIIVVCEECGKTKQGVVTSPGHAFFNPLIYHKSWARLPFFFPDVGFILVLFGFVCFFVVGSRPYVCTRDVS